MSLAIILISNHKISVEALKVEIDSVSFDEQVTLKFIYRVIKVMLSRASRVEAIGVN